MAAGPPPPPVTALDVNIFEAIRIDETLHNAVSSLTSRATRVIVPPAAERTIPETDLDPRQLKALLLTFINGNAELPEQKVHLEYLKNDQKMRIPISLAILPFASNNPEVAPIDTFVARYWKVSTMLYARLETLLTARTAAAAVRAEVDALPLPAERAGYVRWPDVYVRSDGEPEPLSAVSVTYSWLSQCLQINCDIRDMGKLAQAVMRLGDGDWSRTKEMEVDRFSVKLNAWSLQSIAGLNYPHVGRSQMAAWVRAYGVATGVLPARDSRLQKEYVYVAGFAAKDHMNTILEFERNVEDPIYPIAMNFLALFGLFHLAKDHTYRTGDANMERIGMSYLMTMRTMVHQTLMDELKGQQESLVRTAQHPFGLGQTYAVARHMNRLDQLAPALALRITATPPPVQRLFIVVAAKEEWAIMPIGPTFNSVYGIPLNAITAEAKVVQDGAPAYSGLHELYAIEKQMKPDYDAYHAATALMPAVYGYAMVQHMDSNDKKEGLALALSLQNIASQHRTMTLQWQRMWEAYIERSDKEGLEKFIITAYNAMNAVP